MDLETKLKNLPKALLAIPLAASMYAASPKAYADDAEAAALPQATYEALSPTRQNIKALEDAGWTVYDTEEEIKSLKSGKAQYFGRDEYNQALDMNPGRFQRLIDLGTLYEKLVDGNQDNDELNYVVESQRNNHYAQIITEDNSIGKTSRRGYQFYVAFPPEGKFQ